MRCESCSKMVSYDTDLDPEEVEAPNMDGGTFTVSYRRALGCAVCGAELKDTTIEVEVDLSDQLAHECPGDCPGEEPQDENAPDGNDISNVLKAISRGSTGYVFGVYVSHDAQGHYGLDGMDQLSLAEAIEHVASLVDHKCDVCGRVHPGGSACPRMPEDDIAAHLWEVDSADAVSINGGTRKRPLYGVSIDVHLRCEKCGLEHTVAVDSPLVSSADMDDCQ